jgi:hypothetical protein
MPARRASGREKGYGCGQRERGSEEGVISLSNVLQISFTTYSHFFNLIVVLWLEDIGPANKKSTC